jgi:hypothetical protein
MRQLTNQEIKTIVDWHLAVKRQPTDSNVELIVHYLDDHHLPISFETINKAMQSDELKGRLVWHLLEQPFGRVHQNIEQWINERCPKGLIAPSGGIGPDLAAKIAYIIETKFQNWWTLDNLDAALKEVLAPRSTPVPVVKKPIVKGSAAERLAQVGIAAETGRINHARKPENAGSVIDQVKKDTNRVFRFNEWLQAVNSAMATVEYSAGRIDHAKSRNAKRKELARVRAQFPEFAAETRDPS